jgi:LPXTG-motif cell wall-anchored protein
VPVDLLVFMGGGSAPPVSDPDSTAGELAYTGIGQALPVLIGLLALVVGLGMTLAFRRRLDSAVQ